MTVLNEKYGLGKRVILTEVDKDTIAIVKKIKSRIIKKDAIKIIGTAEKIWETSPELQISLICYDNICSKSIELLESMNIEVTKMQE